MSRTHRMENKTKNIGDDEAIDSVASLCANEVMNNVQGSRKHSAFVDQAVIFPFIN